MWALGWYCAPYVVSYFRKCSRKLQAIHADVIVLKTCLMDAAKLVWKFPSLPDFDITMISLLFWLNGDKDTIGRSAKNSAGVLKRWGATSCCCGFTLSPHPFEFGWSDIRRVMDHPARQVYRTEGSTWYADETHVQPQKCDGWRERRRPLESQ